MKIIEALDYEEMSQQGANVMLETIQKKKDAVLCLATGGSPKRMYELFVQRVNDQHIDLSQVTFVKLDEWCDIEPSDRCSCTTFIVENLLDKLKEKPKQFIEFIANATDLSQELKKIDSFLKDNPIDLMVLGLGMDGHLGLNEPSTYLNLNCHIAQLNEKTKSHDMTNGFTLSKGMSIGMKGIFDSHQILMLVCGTKKEESYQSFMNQKITTQVPASFLWLHNNCTTIIDKTQFP